MSTYAGAGRWTGGTLAGVFRCRDDADPSASAWEQLGGGVITGVQVQAITVQPADPQIVLVGARDGLYRSRHAGSNWSRLGRLRARRQDLARVRAGLAAAPVKA